MNLVFFFPFLSYISRTHAREARGVPWARKFSYLPIRENLVMTSAYSVRPSGPSLDVKEGNYKCQPVGGGGGVCYGSDEIFHFKHLARFGGKSRGRPGF